MIKEYFLNYEAMNSDFTIELGRRNGIQLHGAAHGECDWRVTLADTGERAMTGAESSALPPTWMTIDLHAVTYGDGVADVDLTRLWRSTTRTGGSPR